MENLKIFKGYDSIFAERLRFLMKQHSTKQTDLAKHLGLTRQAISKYTDGSVLPNIENLHAICKFFNVSSDYLLGISNTENIVADERLCSEITGLNTNSIKVLKSINTQNEEEQILQKMLNRILIHRGSLIILAQKIIACYNAYVKEELHDNVYINIDKFAPEFDYRTNMFLACDWFDDTITDVLEDIYKERCDDNGNQNK